jgi:hypothetical protein
MASFLPLFLADAVGHGAGHFIGRLHDLGVHFIAALGGNQRRDFLHRIDVGSFQISLADDAETRITGNAGYRHAGGRRLTEEVAANRLETDIIGKVGQRQLAEFAGLDLAIDLGIRPARIR